jgi:hypothetical protein
MASLPLLRLGTARMAPTGIHAFMQYNSTDKQSKPDLAESDDLRRMSSNKRSQSWKRAKKCGQRCFATATASHPACIADCVLSGAQFANTGQRGRSSGISPSQATPTAAPPICPPVKDNAVIRRNTQHKATVHLNDNHPITCTLTASPPQDHSDAL